MTNYLEVLTISTNAERMPRMKEEYYSYDDTAAGVQCQELELDDLYEDVGNKLDDYSPCPVKRFQKASPEGNHYLHYDRHLLLGL